MGSGVLSPRACCLRCSVRVPRVVSGQPTTQKPVQKGHIINVAITRNPIEGETKMYRKQTRIAMLALVVGVIAAWTVPVVWAGSPHFINNAFTLTRTDNSLTVSGKEAGLGDEAQIHVVLSATALCINGGGNHPKAVNKESVSAAGDFPVQNGKADFSLTVTATFQPPCSPPMTVEFTDVTVTDTTNGLSHSFPGTF